MLTIAPENPGALGIVQYLAVLGVLVSAGHSGANYAEALAAFEAGVGSATHLFNAMPPLHHRKPGLIGATLTTPGISATLIVDGVHLHPAIVKLTYQQKGVADIVLITDAMAGMGMPPGRYDLAGQAVIVDDTSAYLDDQNHTLAGSILTLNRAIQNMVEFSGCSPAEAVQMATLNPARLLKIDDHLGHLAPGYVADVAVFSSDFQPLLTIVRGEVVFTDTQT
jgi:N-acetylglucosamine-6-phosphate deacetylase